ncbi:hypothetical protein [Parageobacillus thermoglucosidasius]|uniref:AbiTii domain-containing protein n=1 Tax=Parageobacillus thermoglucosidasius TaxID=1426 RepID=UPI000B576AD0|nr:hypothetical protein [Parageobacillus thermoglucosidasius]OUM85452.1 MAG: hypothetical protein BAA00_03435 [Parageobacillus thermoglucosidasius]
MDSIVLELQREAYDQNVPVTTLLRKAYTVAKKLQISELEKWCLLELNGYTDPESLPDYRCVHGELKAFNPYRGYIPVYAQKELHEILHKRFITQSIAEIEEYIRMGEESKGNMLQYSFAGEQQLLLTQFTGVDFPFSLHIPTSEFKKITERVRNFILEWTLKLEEGQILGEGMTFSQNEKERASKMAENITINWIGTMNNSQLQQHSINSSQSLKVVENEKIKEELITFVNDVKKLLEELQDSKLKEELASDIEVIEAQIRSPKPKTGIIKEALKSIKNIAEGTTSSIIATTIINKIPLLSALLTNNQLIV